MHLIYYIMYSTVGSFCMNIGGRKVTVVLIANLGKSHTKGTVETQQDPWLNKENTTSYATPKLVQRFTRYASNLRLSIGYMVTTHQDKNPEHGNKCYVPQQVLFLATIGGRHIYYVLKWNSLYAIRTVRRTYVRYVVHMYGTSYISLPMMIVTADACTRCHHEYNLRSKYEHYHASQLI